MANEEVIEMLKRNVMMKSMTVMNVLFIERERNLITIFLNGLYLKKIKRKGYFMGKLLKELCNLIISLDKINHL